MTKQLRNIIITVCVAAVILTAFLILIKTPILKNTTSSSSAAAINLLSTDSNNIEKIAVSNAKGKYTIVKTAKDNWTVEELKNTAVDTSSVNSAVTAAAAVTASKVIKDDASTDDLATYGLDNPQARLDYSLTGNKSFTLEIGKADPLGGGNYVKVDGSNKVYLSSNDFTAYLDSDSKFISLILLTVDSTNDVPNITRFNFAGSQRKAFEIDTVTTASSSAASSGSTTSQDYKIVTPSQLEADSSKMSDLVNALASVSATDVVDLDTSTANLKKYGLDNPLYTFSYTEKNQTSTLLFGNTVTDGSTTDVYVMLQGRKVVYKIAESTLSFYKDAYTDLASKMLFMENIDTVKTVTITSGSQSYVFNLSGISDNLAVSYGSKKITSTNFRHLYEEIVGLSAAGTAVKPTTSSVFCTIRIDFRTASKSPDVFNFVLMNGQQCFWDYNGKGEFYVLKSDLQKIVRDAGLVSTDKDVVVY